MKWNEWNLLLISKDPIQVSSLMWIFRSEVNSMNILTPIFNLLLKQSEPNFSSILYFLLRAWIPIPFHSHGAEIIGTYCHNLEFIMTCCSCASWPYTWNSCFCYCEDKLAINILFNSLTQNEKDLSNTRNEIGYTMSHWSLWKLLIPRIYFWLNLLCTT